MHTYTVQVGQNGDDEKRDSIEEAHEDEPKDTNSALSGNLTVGLVHVLPDLQIEDERQILMSLIVHLRCL